MPPDLLTRCWFLAGPTAVGKTAVGIELAEHIHAEILCLDSMTLYRGMDIGTAKPTAEEQVRCPHHLLDVIAPPQEFSVAEYLRLAEAACRDVLARGKTPLFVGGTGLYLRLLLRGVFQGPAADWTLRERLETESRARGDTWLHDQLRLVDPATASRLHPRDLRRIIRAIEVFELTGRPLSEQQQQAPLPLEQRPQHVYWLSPPREWLYQRIDQRVLAMFDTGFMSEIAALRRMSQPLSRTARQALGYKEIFDWLEASNSDAGLPVPPEIVAEIQLRTRQFAKRQHTWFRNLEECQEWPIRGNETPAQIAEQMAGSTRVT